MCLIWKDTSDNKGNDIEHDKIKTGSDDGLSEISTEKIYSFYETTEVTFYPMSDEEIRAYVASGDPMDKAGAYGIQGPCAIYIQEIKGGYNNVVGLPIARIYQELKRLGLD